VFRTKRVYDDPSPDDGRRVLVDRLWPRGVSKEDAALDRWLQSAAPSDALREWFDHDPEKWDGFRRAYWTELRDSEAVAELRELESGGEPVTLVYAARDREHNNAVALRAFLESERDD
jgi:uncharacterized protein YeaO (DUF488 family)